VTAAVLIGLAVTAIYAQTRTFGFVAYDDDQYVYANRHVTAGLSTAGFGWALTTFHYANWHPVTWISYMADERLFGGAPGAMHLVNVAIHMSSAVLLLFTLARLTRRRWESAFVSAIFAVHPLHVESVAWISERKDVLCTFFSILTVLLYARYLERRSIGRYSAMLAAFALSLMSKSMAVTLPFLLLLLDYWPLGRIEWPPAPSQIRHLLLEKSPLFALAAAASALTFLAQQRFGAVSTIRALPFDVRFLNAVVAYVSYIFKAIWPVDLGVLYPLHTTGVVSAAAAGAVVLLLSAVAVFRVRQMPHLLVGWLWYLGTLIPVIGLVQVGSQSMADRYMYFPLIGLSVAVVWSGSAALPRHVRPRLACVALCAAGILAMAAQAYAQVRYWRNSQTLFEHTLAVTRSNYIIENNLGVVVARAGDSARAMDLYRDALKLSPDYSEAHTNLGHELLKTGRLDEAFENLTKASTLKPGIADTEADLGLLFAARGVYSEARQHLEQSLQAGSANAETESNLCFVLHHLGHMDAAVTHCKAALVINRDFASAHFNLGNIYAAQGQKAAAAKEFTRVLAADPTNSASRAALDQLLRDPAGRHDGQ
jgi:tetratricopeptide (TPR) repeat protein